MRRMMLAVLILFLASLMSSYAAEKNLPAVFVERGPKVDGLLDDAVWQKTTPYSDFASKEPVANGTPSEKTELRVLYDRDNLYIGVICFDSEPKRIAANSLAHDTSGSSSGGEPYHMVATAKDDLLRVLLDPFQDRRTAYVFFVNPRGARGEGLASEGNVSLDWDGIWDARSRILPNGWSSEFRIPFKTISFKPGLTSWGINVERLIARKQETIRLSGSNRDSIFYNPMEAASLEGIQGVRQGRGITFRPYGLVSATKDQLQPGGMQWKVDGGFDLYKNFTPNLVGAFSLNTDFAETEVDERRINLTRFPLFFPEKRMFFLEGSQTFNFSSSMSFQPFFSRQIGLYNGQPVPIIFGVKLYGKVGRMKLAVLDVQTDDFGELLGSNFLALRLTRDLFAESKVGVVFTNGSSSGARNTLAALDFQYSTSKLAGNKNLMLAAWMAYNWNEQTDGSHLGFGFRADYPNDLWDIRSVYAYYGEALDPGLGFMMRRGIQTFYLRLGFQPRPVRGWLDRLVRQFFFNASGDFYWSVASGRLETSKLSASPLTLSLESGEQISLEVEANRDVLPDDFEVAKGVVLPAGAYDFTNCKLNINSAAHRPVVLNAGFNFGEFYSGHYYDLNAGVTFQFKGFINLALDFNIVHGHLPQGSFSENVYQLKADFYLTPNLGLMNYIQFDDVSNALGVNNRLRWQISPGNEIFLVYSKNWVRCWDPHSRFVPQESRGVLKIQLSIRP